MLGLHHQLAGGVEERGRTVVALLDIGRVGGADQRRPHLVAGGAQSPDQHLQGYRVHRASIVPWSSTAVDQLGGTTKVASGSSKTAGPSVSKPAAGSPRRTSVSIHSPPSKKTGRELCCGA